MNVLIFSQTLDVAGYKSYLADYFPELTFHATTREDEALASAPEADILVGAEFPNQLLERAVKVKWIHAMIAGTDYIEALPEFKARKQIVLTSSRGIHGPQVSELVILFMIALNRRFTRNVLNQQARVWERWPGRLLDGKTAVILGMGTIGQALARRCKAFDMTVYGIGPRVKAIEGLDGFFLLPELHRAAASADFFICIAPSTSHNRNMLDAGFFAVLKPTAYFINVGRGEVVDQTALADVLRQGRIAGAAVDTFAQEPLPPDDPLWTLDNLVITPHIAGFSDTYIQQAVPVFRENLRRWLAGERENLINRIPRVQ